MKDMPKQGDRVLFVLCGISGKPRQIIAEGIVKSNGWEVNASDLSPHRYYPTNIGTNKGTRTPVNEFVWIDVKPVYKVEDFKNDGQRTWRKIK
jgi:hypothetical protein